ncbi:rhodanese-like domain-containing protein [Nitratiruptor tergarcus]|uniref:Rhodanese-related sulfurtransferase n=1 Tax=Nitratiruptor tergarcus DSM 16512 TaxID=1069081 RepID=A0A1W1WST5_9BACT|nr:rhodanese-like domain-containing protein [Nitratiruptor tergarcus]SMC09357.1 Rhodanese-related sulfurtransferase [Nitratiruptor tergarcus DSM 16512]
MRTFLFLCAMIVSSFAFENVNSKEFANLLRQKDVVLFDVRTPQEFQEGHILGANLVPVQVFQYLKLGGLGIKNKKILVYCRSGNRSVTASRWFESWGAKKVYNLRGGILEWKAAGFPLQK